MLYLGTIDNAGSDVKNNLNTSTPFEIPPGTTGLRLQPSAATMGAAIKQARDATFLPSAITAMLQLGAAQSFNDATIPGDRMLPPPVTLAVRKTDVGAGTTKVFAI